MLYRQRRHTHSRPRLGWPRSRRADIADDYTDVMPLLERRAVVVELRGHGRTRSDAPQSSYDLATLAADVGAVVAQSPAGTVVLGTVVAAAAQSARGTQSQQPLVD